MDDAPSQGCNRNIIGVETISLFGCPQTNYQWYVTQKGSYVSVNISSWLLKLASSKSCNNLPISGQETLSFESTH
jgi:hypothetical protein